MGGLPGDVPERYAVADPAVLPRPRVPVTLVHGTADDRVPVAMSRLTPSGRLIEIEGAGHFDLIDPPAAERDAAALAVHQAVSDRYRENYNVQVRRHEALYAGT